MSGRSRSALKPRRLSAEYRTKAGRVTATALRPSKGDDLFVVVTGPAGSWQYQFRPSANGGPVFSASVLHRCAARYLDDQCAGGGDPS